MALEDEEEERKQLEKKIIKAKSEYEKSCHSEIESDAKKINEEMIRAMDGIREETKRIQTDIDTIKNVVEKIFQLTVEIRFKVSFSSSF